MGNGRGLSGSGMKWVGFGGAVLLLSLTACAILALGSGSNPTSASAHASASPLSAALKSASLTPKAKPGAQDILSHLPMIFEANQGQANSDVKFVSRGQGYSVYLDQTGAMLTMRVADKPGSNKRGSDKQGSKLESVRMNLVGANPAAMISGGERLPGTSNYFIGNDPSKWQRGVPQFAGVRYQSVYPGIDLIFYGNQGRLEYDFKVAPGADPSQAELQFDGANKVALSGGDLVLKGTAANVRLQAPQIYQRDGDRRQPVQGKFVLRADNRVGFEIGVYDRSRELVIDPTISYSTYFGGSSATSQPYVAVNNNGFIYLTGSTTSSDLPVTTNAKQATLAGAENIFVLELDPTAASAQVLYLTYLGGSGTDTAAGIAVDSGNNVYVAGTTTSPNFPTANGFQTVPQAGSTGASHVFVSELSQITAAIPVLNYSTYLSGNGTDVASGMTVDSNANVFVTGTTTSTDVATGFPSSNLPKPYQQSPSADSTIQFFVTEVSTRLISSASVPYSTYFGGGTPTGAVAIGGSIVADTVGNVYFSGTTNFYNSGEGSTTQTTDFPILNAYQPCLDTPVPTTIIPPVTCTAPATTPYPTDAFVAKLNPANAITGAQQLFFSTYLGGTQADSGTGIAIDTGAADVYITGSTNSSDIVLPLSTPPFQDCLNIPVNPTNGTTGCVAATPTSPTDAYVAKFLNPTNAVGTTTTSVGLSYFSYLGGTGNDSGLAIAVDPADGALLTGATSSTDFPASIGAIQTHLNGTQNAYFGHLNTMTQSGTNTVGSYVTYFGGNGVDRGTSVTLDANLNTYLAGDTTSTNLQVQGALQPTLTGTVDAFAVKLQTAADLCIRCVMPVLNPATGVQGAGNPVTMTFTITNQGPDLATNVIVTGQLSTGTAATFNPATAGSGTCSAPSGTVVVCTIPTLLAGSLTTVTFSVTPTQAGNGSVTATVASDNNTNNTVQYSASFQATNYSVSISPASQTVVAGSVATYAVQVSPSQSYGNTVSLACSGLNIPTGASCGFSPTSLTFNGTGAQTATLNLTTTSRPPVTISSLKGRGPIYAFWLMIPGMALAGLGSSKRSRSRVAGWLALVLLFGFFALQPACSKTKQQATVAGTPAGSYPLTVTATSGSFTQSQGFSLTVQ